MADPFVAEIRILPYSFAPRGWAWCNGQLLPIMQNTALFSLLGTTYGGNGTTNFALPNLQGSVPIHQGEGPGLSPYTIGQSGGSETVTLIASQMPMHTHSLRASTQAATQNTPQTLAGAKAYSSDSNAVQLAPQALSPAGGDQPHNNMQPYLTMNFCIALNGIYPPRS